MHHIVMEDISVNMEDSSSRIEDPTYPEPKDKEHNAFLRVFFCFNKEGLTC